MHLEGSCCYNAVSFSVAAYPQRCLAEWHEQHRPGGKSEA